MAYGSLKVNRIIFNSGGTDYILDVTSLVSNGSNFSGGTIQATSITGVTGVFTSVLSGALITGSTGNITTFSGSTGIFTSSLSGNAITGTSLNATFVTGNTVTATTLTANTGTVGNLTSSTTVSGGTISGTSATLTSFTGASGSFSSVVSGALYKCSGNITIISGSGDIRPYGLYSFPQSVGTNNYVLATNGNGTTAWVEATGGGGGGSSYQISGLTTNTTGVAGTYYVLLSGLTFTLPASPSQGDYVGIINRSNTTTGTVARNGSNIMGLAEDMTINDLNARFRLIYVDASQGWVTL